MQNRITTWTKWLPKEFQNRFYSTDQKDAKMKEDLENV
jgi:hypothetical protein